jgi:hypothetical protein
VRHCVQCGKGKRKRFAFYICSRITGIETKMLLIVFLGLIAKLTSASDICGDENKYVKHLHWNKVGINVSIQME